MVTRTMRKIRIHQDWNELTPKRSLTRLEVKAAARFIRMKRTPEGIVSRLVWKVLYPLAISVFSWLPEETDSQASQAQGEVSLNGAWSDEGGQTQEIQRPEIVIGNRQPQVLEAESLSVVHCGVNKMR